MEKLGVAIGDTLIAALEQSTVASVLVGEAGEVLFFNDAAERLWGCGRGEMLGQPAGTLFPADMPLLEIGAAGRHAASVGSDVRLERKDGQPAWANVAMWRVSCAGRDYRIAFARDVSEEIAQREEKRLLQMAVDCSDRPILVLDAQRRIVRVNRAFTDLLGYEAHEMLGKEPIPLLSGPILHRDELERFVALPWGRERVLAEQRARCKDGHEIWVRISSSPIADGEQDRLNGYSVDVLYDITEERVVRDLERNVLAALNSSLPFAQLGAYLCRQAREAARDVLPSILRVDQEGKLRSWAVAYLPAGYNVLVDGLPIDEGAGSCGTAAVRGTQVIAADIEHDPLWARHADVALAHGLRACWSYPIKRRDGSVAGTFAFYATEPREPTALHERIIEVCAHLCALAIEREEHRLSTERLVKFDSLTGLPNLHNLSRYVDDLLATAALRPIGCFVLGLDRFKDINDALEHATGDSVLVTMANRLQEMLEPGDFLSRTEGDQFVLVARDCNARRASVVAQRLLQCVSCAVEIDGLALSLSASVGISLYPENGREGNALLANAKQAMHRAKEAGGASYQFFNPAMNGAVQERVLLTAALKRAIAGERLTLAYQPQVGVADGLLHGMEALARWQDETFGVVSPAKFIGLAEEFGLIEDLGRWALREVCRQLAQWRAEGLEVPKISVNLSPVNFRSGSLTAYIEELLQEFALRGDSLTLELTESTMVALTPEMMGNIHALRALEVGLSVDDFGTGFSSLANLINLPVTELKVDRSFIRKCLEESRHQSLVATVIGMGRNLGLTVVAEGVEREDQRRWLARQGCPVIQGYLFSRPLTPQDATAWLAAGGPFQPASVH
ncbi:Oxygen sensor protein DosP [Pigmentiphaga humi]|uniref:Oxygen sensor protein DosP n=1 Tax=Pigmentiphaga humi TaxID=2478468 RepID=A0A3P4AVQ2_9BURK|nr:oxygen-sensing cyclic-di-GMP phosphodiesterase DosP [Pigmentiphaga humi]VCU68087.1 Oxygen sensor protein DosP [Pigmentiphaga humi]